MKSTLIPTLAFATLLVGAGWQATRSEEPTRGSTADGIVLLPLDFYGKHREALRLSDDQLREMQKISEGLREPAQKLEGELRERAKAMQEAVAQNPIDADKATERFQAMLKAENEMKALQFRSRVAMRKVLTAEQYEKVRPLAMQESASRGGATSGEIHGKLQQLRGELLARLERIEQAATQGRGDEAQGQLDALLGNLRDEPGANRRASGADRPGGGDVFGQRMHQMAEALERTSDPEQRERIQREMNKLRESRESLPHPPEGKRPEGAPRAGGDGLEQQVRRIAEAAERAENPEQRERLQGALRGLREAAEAGNREAVEKILRAVEPMLRGVPRKE